MNMLGVKKAPQSYIWKCQECDKIGRSPDRDHPCSVCNEDCLVGGDLVLQAAREVSAGRRTGTFQLHCCWVFISNVSLTFISQRERKTSQQEKCQEEEHLREGRQRESSQELRFLPDCRQYHRLLLRKSIYLEPVPHDVYNVRTPAYQDSTKHGNDSGLQEMWKPETAGCTPHAPMLIGPTTYFKHF